MDTEDDIAALRAEVQELAAQLDDREQKATRRLRWRQRLVVALGIVSCLLLFVSIVGVWAERTIYETDRWLAIVEDLPSTPAVSEGIAERLTDEIVTLTNPEERIRAALPPDAAVLAGPIATALETLVTQVVADVIASDQFRSVWIAINRFAHEELVAVLDGDSGLVSSRDGEVYLNLLPLVSDVLERVPAGLFGQGSVPDISVNISPDDARRAISSYLGVTVPDDFGEVKVFESDQLSALQNALTWFNRLVVLSVIATFAFGALTIFLSRRRRRTIVGLGIGVAATVAATWVVLRAIDQQVVDSLSNQRSAEIAGSIFGTLLSDLRTSTVLLLLAGVLAASVAFLMGDSRPALWTREQVRALSAGTAAAAMRTSQGGSAAAWTARNEVGLRVGGVVVALLILLFFHASWGWLLFLLVLLALWQLAITALVHLSGRGSTEQEPSEGAIVGGNLKGEAGK